MDKNLNYTMKFETMVDEKITASEVLQKVYDALKEKGYNPINQFIGYFLSGDPTYITSHNNARAIITKVERDELLEEILKEYLKGK
ncbi:IreB family regulatory phosphoprotein [Peptostreptococcaceae bacterium AGR-M142]|jgi:uncharacterized protein (UPF0297 family)|nr:IreB family regulatory phosphoprotein [Peptostreptococcaceae bacterium]